MSKVFFSMIIWTFFQTSDVIFRYQKCYLPNALRVFFYLDLYYTCRSSLIISLFSRQVFGSIGQQLPAVGCWGRWGLSTSCFIYSFGYLFIFLFSFSFSFLLIYLLIYSLIHSFMHSSQVFVKRITPTSFSLGRGSTTCWSMGVQRFSPSSRSLSSPSKMPSTRETPEQSALH